MVVALVAVIIFGALHGLEPAHGWPVALFYAVSKRRPTLYGLLSSSIMAGAHFTSSIVAVVLYLVLRSLVALSLPILKYAAALILIILALRFWVSSSNEQSQHGHLHDVLERLEHSHDHTHGDGEAHSHEHVHEAKIMTLSGLVGFSFVIGFAHEEEFALLALAVGGVDPVLLMVSYALAVTVSLVGITVASVRAYRRFRDKMRVVERYTPKITAVILLGLAAAFILNLA